MIKVCLCLGRETLRAVRETAVHAIELVPSRDLTPGIPWRGGRRRTVGQAGPLHHRHRQLGVIPVIHLLPLVIYKLLLLLDDTIVAECLSAADLGEVVDPCKLQDGGQTVEKTADDEPVQSSGVVNLDSV